MWSILYGYPFVESTYDFYHMPLCKNVNARVAAMAKVNDYLTTIPTECSVNGSCQLSSQQLTRLRDINSSKGLPSIQELYDLRPCYLRGFRNLWVFVECFHHILTVNVMKKDAANAIHDIKKHGITQSTTTYNFQVSSIR